MTHLLLLVGGWAAKTASPATALDSGALQILQLALALLLMLALWRIAERHQRELRAQRDDRVVPLHEGQGHFLQR